MKLYREFLILIFGITFAMAAERVYSHEGYVINLLTTAGGMYTVFLLIAVLFILAYFAVFFFNFISTIPKKINT